MTSDSGGFAAEVTSKYNADMFALFQSLFNLLPLATRINNEVLVVHGGLCRTGTATLDQMRAVDRKRPVPVTTTDPRDLLFFDTMWSDPQVLAKNPRRAVLVEPHGGLPENVRICVAGGAWHQPVGGSRLCLHHLWPRHHTAIL